MTENKKAMEDVICLASIAVGAVSPKMDRIKAMNLSAVYKAAGSHLLCSICAYALELAGIEDIRFTQAKARAIRKAALLDADRRILFERLTDAGIWHMSLKGSVIKDLYPAAGMREMADQDILFDADRACDVRSIMEEMGYSTKYFGAGNHDVYFKDPVYNFEMHRSLFGPGHDQKMYGYYRDFEKRLLGDGYEKAFSAEDFYIYMTAHEYKHYRGGGTGLRSLLDTYIYLRNYELDMDYVKAETKKIGIDDFERRNASLALHLFQDGCLTEEDRQMLDYILSSGTYGSLTHLIENSMQAHQWNKFQYMLHRFMVPVSQKNMDYDIYAEAYPFFYQHKLLLPILPFYRTVRSMRRGRFMAEANAIRKAQKRKKQTGRRIR